MKLFKRKEQDAVEELKKEETVQKEQKFQEKTKVSSIEYLIESALNRMTHGELDVQENEFEVTYSKIMSNKLKKRIIFIKEIPQTVRPGYLENIRNKVMSLIPVEERSQVLININSHSFPYQLDMIGNKRLNTSKNNFTNQMKELQGDLIRLKTSELSGKKRFSTNREDEGSMKTRIGRFERKIFSFDYTKAYKQNGGQVLKTYMYLECCGATVELCDKVADLVMGQLQANDYKFLEINELREYLQSFGVANLDYSLKPTTKAFPLTLPTDVSSADLSYSEGIIRSEQGDIYVMTSLDTKYPVFISMSESSSNNNMLLVADSGSGKTQLMKFFILNCMNHKNSTYNIIVDDIKGSEYNFDKFLKRTAVISMGISNPRFIDTIAIPDYRKFGFPSPEAAYDLCSSITVKMLSTLVSSTDPAIQEKVYNICSDIVNQIYMTLQVQRVLPTTYERSHGLKYRETVWDAIKLVTTSDKSMETRHGKSNLGFVRTSLEPYFGDKGPKQFMFSECLDIDEAMDLKMLIFDYGTQTAGGQSSMLDKEIETRLIMRNFFATLYSAKNKLNKEYTIIIEEEIQRQINNPFLAKMLNDAVTGGRSSNMATILMTNTVGGLLSSKDADISAIRENIRTVLLGKSKKEAANQIIEFFGLEQARDRVIPILSGTGKYEYSFLFAFNTGKVFDITLGKLTAPPQLFSHEMFKSRDVELIREKKEDI